MSFNGSGVFVINSTGQPVSASTLIEASVFNAFTADVATGLSTAITKDGQTTVTTNLPMAGYKFTGLGAGSTAGQSLRYEQLFTTSAVAMLGAMDWVKGADIASAGTINLTTATGNGVHVTGTTTITAVTLGSGMLRMVVFDGILTLTHHATTNNLPGAANITTAAGDRALYWADGTTVYCLVYQPAAGYLSGSSIGVTVQAYDADTLKADVTAALSVGFTATDYNAGTKSTGTFTPNPASGAFQYAINGGAHTLAPPANSCTMIIQYTNNGSAGTITTSGFTKVTGTAPATTDTYDYLAFITRINGFTHLAWQALQ